MEPESVLHIGYMGSTLNRARRFEEALAALRPGLGKGRSPGLRMHTAAALAGLGRYGEALDMVEEGLRVASTPRGLSLRAYMLIKLGRREEAVQVLEAMRAPVSGRPRPDFQIATMLAALGQTDAAFESLERAVARRSFQVVDLKTDFRMDSLRGDTRYRDLLRRIRLE
jgi:tetratricopeptide (TPR) repeat protein